MLPDTAGPDARAALARELGLDKPLPVQFLDYLGRFVRGDLGASFRAGVPVTSVIGERIPATLELAGFAMALTVLLAVPLGVLAASRQGTWVDAAVRSLAFAGQSLPNFWVAIVLVLVFSVSLGWFPAGGRSEPASIILPGITMSLYTMAGVVRVLRSSMLEVWRADFVTTAIAKGAPRQRVIVRHILRNALIPTVTYGGVVMVLHFLAGSIVVETVFAWPGVGRLLYEAILARDFPIVQAIALLYTALYVTANLLIDLLYRWLDPRIG